jgi:hypothetical protein
VRAIIDCNLSLGKEALRDLFENQIHWWPPYEQNDPIVLKERDHILNLVYSADRDLVSRTYCFMFYHHRTQSWGLVNSPQEGIVEIRIRNGDSLKLRRACEALIAALKSYETKHKINLTFEETIRILEPDSNNEAYDGEILPDPDFKHAKADRAAEWRVGIIFLVVSLFFTGMTIPSLQHFIEAHLLSKEWTEWGAGFIGRMATSAIVTSLVSFLAVFFHMYDLRRMGVVRWHLRGVRPKK